VKVFDFLQANNPTEIAGTTLSYSILPSNSIVLQNVAKHITTNPVCKTTIEHLKQLPSAVKYVFIDASYDPVMLTDTEILIAIELVQQQFTSSQVIFLSSKCGHYYSQHKNILWYPTFLLWNYQTIDIPRQKRIGCLNRRNAPHRIWLMHNLLDQGLIDHERDIFSVAFAHFLDHARTIDIDSWLGFKNTNYNTLIKQYPDSITTVPDDFSNGTPIDMTADHPAWRTAVTIVTETECGEYGMISEKTVKALANKCCWIAYTGSDCIRVLDDLGFNTKLYSGHAHGVNIDPIIQVCKTLDTESVAMDYYNLQLPHIQHNKYHLDHDWQVRYLPKLQQALDSL
jgi:hypothetical protein